MMQPAPAPQWLIEACGYADTSRRPAIYAAPVIDINQEAARKRGEHYITTEAPESALGGRNDTAYKVAAKLKDIGLDQSAALELMDFWAETKCDPPLDAEEVEHVVTSAYQYGKSAQGSDAPEAVFSPVEEENAPETAKSGDLMNPKPTRPPMIIQAVADIEATEIPPRRWLLGNFLLIGKVTELIAPPGAGKSTFSLQVGMSVVTGQDYAGMAVKEAGKVLMINNEDDPDELHRRQEAIRQYYNIDFTDLNGRLWLYSGVERPFIMARRTIEGTVKAVDKREIINFIKANNIKLLVADPFLETHMVNENANEEISQVARMYRQVAVQAECAVLLVHHTRKQPAGSSDGHAGNMESGRGASALTGVARIVSTLYSMSKKDAKTFGVPDNQRHLYVRLDDAKANLSLLNYRAKWYRKASVNLANGDDVGVLEVADLAPLEEAEDDAILEAVALYVATHDGEGTLHAVAKFAAESLGEDEKSQQTVKRKIKEKLAKKQVVSGWVIWYAEDDRPATKNSGASKHWVYGHIDEEVTDNEHEEAKT